MIRRRFFAAVAAMFSAPATIAASNHDCEREYPNKRIVAKISRRPTGERYWQRCPMKDLNVGDIMWMADDTANAPKMGEVIIAPCREPDRAHPGYITWGVTILPMTWNDIFPELAA